MNSTSGGSRLRAPQRTTSSAPTIPWSMIIRSGIPHSLPDGEVSGVLRSPCASSQITPSRSNRAARPSTAPMWEQQHPPRTSGTSGRSDATASVCIASVSSSTTATSGKSSGSAAASTIGSPPAPHARGTRTSPAAKVRPQEWHSYSVVDGYGGQRPAVGAAGAENAHASDLLEGDAARLDVHAGALVQVGRAGLVLRVDVERDARRAAPPELGKGAGEQGFCETLAPPCRTNADRADVTVAGSPRLVARHRGQLVAVADDEPQGAVLVMVLVPPELDPLLERPRVPLPVVRERLVQRVEERALLAVPKRVHQ